MDTNRLLSMLDDGLDIYRHWMGRDIRAYKTYKSPFREERHGSFSLYYKSRGIGSASLNTVWWKDHREEAGSAWDFVMRQKNCSFAEAIEYVRVSLLGLPAHPDWVERLQQQYLPPPVLKAKARKNDFTLTAYPRKAGWLAQDRAYYPAGIIDLPTLDAFHCSPLEAIHFKSDAWDITTKATPTDPLYEYWFPGSDSIKVVRPNARNKRRKWISNTHADRDIFGMHLTPARVPALVLIAGNRDAMAGWQLCEQRLPFWALTGEGVYPTPQQIHLMKTVAERIYVLYDHDTNKFKTGQTWTEKLCAEHSFLPDLHELYEHCQVNDMMNLLEPRTPDQRLEVRDWLLDVTGLA